MARVGVLVSALPQDASTVQALVPAAVWSLEAHLLASLIEQTDALRKQMVALWGDKRKISQRDLKPLKIDRPGMPSKFERRGTPLGHLLGED